MAYHNLADFGWALGVHRAPVGYEHPWLVVTAGQTVGCWSRQEARDYWRSVKPS